MDMLMYAFHRTMQNCFREHPDIYGSELEDDDAPLEGDAPSPAPSPESGDGSIPLAATSAVPETQSSSANPSTSRSGSSDTERAQVAKRQVESDHSELTSESDDLVPKAAHDATGVKAGK